MSKTDKLRNTLKRMEHVKGNGIMSSRDIQKKKNLMVLSRFSLCLLDVIVGHLTLATSDVKEVI